MTTGADENPYRAPSATIAAPGIEGAVVYAGFWRRLLAWVIDQVALQIALGLMRAIASLALLRMQEGSPSSGAGVALAIVFIAGSTLIGAAYFIVCWHQLQGSLGHLAVGARVRDASGYGDLTWLQCAVRYLGCLAAWLPIGFGFIWAAFDARKQGWHDKIASTVVVRV